MGRSTERSQDSQLSVWTFEAAEQAPSPPLGWLAALTAWPRWPGRSRSAPAAPHPPAEAAPVDPAMPTQPGRGRLLRQAHRALHDRMRTQRALRRVLPHLYFIERALAHQGSAALQELPVWVLQRGLQQLARLPADNLAERAQFSVLQQRLGEAIAQRLQLPAAQRPAPRSAPDSFMGGPDSRMSSRGPPDSVHSGLEVTELPDSVFNDLLQDRLPTDTGPAGAALRPVSDAADGRRS